MENSNTIDSILHAFEEIASKKIPLSPHQWLEGSAKMLALVGSEQDRLFDLESVIAKYKSELMYSGEMTSAKAKIMAEARHEYVEARKLKAKIDRVFEAIKIGKVMARTSDNEWKSN